MPARSIPRLAIGVLSALALLLAAVPAATADATATQLTLSQPAPVKAGSAVTFTATATDSSQPPVPVDGVHVTLYKVVGATATAVSNGTTAGSGQVALASGPLAAGNNVFEARDDSGTLVSPQVTVVGQRFGSRLTLTGPSSVVDEKSVRLSVRWLATDATPIVATVRVQRRVGSGAWTAYTSLRTASDGRAAFTTTPRVDTSYRVLGSSGTWWLAPASATHAVDNLPPGTPVRLPSAAPKPTYIAPNARATGSGANVVVTTIPDSVWRSMVGRTWHSGCPVGRSGLRLLRVNYWGFDGYRYRGEMVLATAVVRRAGAAFADMYAGHYPIRRMFREDRFGWSQKLHGANDYASMRADNTSGFNCRSVVNKPGVLSPHARGRAIDINTWENPYRSATGLVPDAWWASHSHPLVAWRSASHPVVRIWRKHGFRWTYANVDSQHLDGRRTAAVVMGGFSG